MMTISRTWSLFMTRKKKYFPNNWRAIKDTPSSVFSHPPLSFDDFMAWKIEGYQIPTSVSCIIREQDVETGKVTEHVYKRQTDAKNKARAIMEAGESEFVVCSRDAVHVVYPLPNEEDYDYDEY